MSDKHFDSMVTLMDECQGDLLRSISDAVGPIVKWVCLQSADLSKQFAVEDIERARILQYPKGAPEVLELFRRRYALPVREEAEAGSG